jgi:hypothetical protein
LKSGAYLEEGLPMETPWRVSQSMRRAAEAGLEIGVGLQTKVGSSFASLPWKPGAHCQL